MAGFGVNIDLKVITTKEQLVDQVKKQIGDAIDIGAKLVVDPGSIETLSKSLQEALDKKQFKVNIGNVKLLDSARNEMKKQIESMFGYSTKETTLETKELQKQVELLQKKAAAYEANAKKAESELQKQRESLKTTQEKTIALKNQKDALSEMYNTTKKLVEKSGSNDLKNELTMYKQLMNELNVKKEVLSDDQLNSRIEGMRQLAAEARNVISAQEEKARSDREAAAASKEAERSEETRTALLGQLEYQYHKLVASMERFQHTGMTDVDTIDDEEVKATVEQYENLKKIFEQALQSSDEFSNEAIQDLYKQASAIEKVTGAIRSEATEQKRQNELLRQADALYQNMYQFVQSNTAASARGAAINGGHDTGAAVQSLMNDLQVRKDNGTLTPQDLTEIRRQYDLLVNSAKTLNIVGRESDSVFKQLFSRFSFVSLIVTGFHKAIAVCREMVENVKNLDAAMTELRKVTTETEAGYAKFFETAGERAKELGATVVDVISATADFARLGYSLDDASVLADVATVYKNVGDGITSIDTAAESIISTMKAFGIEAQDAINIVDKFNETGRNYCRAA